MVSEDYINLTNLKTIHAKSYEDFIKQNFLFNKKKK